MSILIKYFDMLWDAIETQQKCVNFDLIAWVILPDHFHILISAGTEDISALMRKIKLSFSAKYRKAVNRRRGRVWQYRFGDHIIRDQDDLNRHLDYIHYNPVKHSLVNDPVNWKYSSFHDYVKQSLYMPDWGAKDIEFPGEFGE